MNYIEPLVILLSFFVGFGLAALPVTQRFMKRLERKVLKRISES